MGFVAVRTGTAYRRLFHTAGGKFCENQLKTCSLSASVRYASSARFCFPKKALALMLFKRSKTRRRSYVKRLTQRNEKVELFGDRKMHRFLAFRRGLRSAMNPRNVYGWDLDPKDLLN